MAWKRPTAGMVAVGAIVFVLGFAMGALVVSAVASRASRAYLLTAQYELVSAQDQQASEAWRMGDVESAAGHAFCAVEVAHGEGARAFGEAMPWDPIGLAFLQAAVVEPNHPAMERSQPSREAVARAKLAVTWERLGRADAADRELGRAAALTGAKDVAKLRQLGLDTVDVWSKVQEQHSASSTAPDREP